MKRKPTKEELQAAWGKTLPDVIKPGLKILFAGINPGLYTAAIQHHFGRPGNKFWPALHKAGFTKQLLSPYEERDLLKSGFGITNVVAHATATADELKEKDFQKGGKVLTAKIKKFKPRVVAILGVTAYRLAFNQPKAKIGLQIEKIGSSKLWILPNPSGLNAHYQVKDIAHLLKKVKRAAQ